MSLYDSDRRYRRRFWSGIIRFGIFAGMLGGTAFISYQAGIEELDSNVRGYQREIHELESQQNALEQETRSEEHTSELQSLMRISYAVFCLKKKKNKTKENRETVNTRETQSKQLTIKKYNHDNIGKQAEYR